MTPLLRDSPEASLLVDDRVQDKRYSRSIDVTKRQYPGNAHGMVTSIGLVNGCTAAAKRAILRPWITAFARPTRTDRRKSDHFLALFDQFVAADNLLARRMGLTIYQAHQQQWAPYLRQLLQKLFT